jgi:hypothetical protein
LVSASPAQQAHQRPALQLPAPPRWCLSHSRRRLPIDGRGHPLLSIARGFISASVGFFGRSGPLLGNRDLSQLLCLYQFVSEI